MPQDSKHKRGDVHPITGNIFWSYDKTYVNGARWMPPEKFHATRNKTLARDASWYERNRDLHREKSAAWFQANKHKVNAYHARPLVKLARNIRAKCNQMIRLDTKHSRASEILGCSRKEFRAWIKSTFQKGMTWSNYGEWELDHIIPFKEAKTEADVYWLAYYKNTRALWRKQNRNKYTKH